MWSRTCLLHSIFHAGYCGDNGGDEMVIVMMVISLIIMVKIPIIVDNYTDTGDSDTDGDSDDTDNVGEIKDSLSSVAPILGKCCEQFGGNDTFLENVRIKILNLRS